MSTHVSKGFRSMLRMEEEEAKASERQGIGSILGSEPERPKSGGSLRRTLSADMSSKKWLSQHGFSPLLKKVASSDGFPDVSVTDSSSSEGEEDYHQERKKIELEQPAQFDIWTSILSQKANESSSLSPPYVHPLVKRSASSLSEKSLEICTESLGSETGSECFSSYPPSETSDVEDDMEEEEEEEEQEQKQEKESQSEYKEEMGTVRYSFCSSKRSPPRSFPPPLPSLSRRDGPCLHMISHRKDGRLVLEAVPVPSHNYFHAQRHNGRLLLTFITNTPSEPPTNMNNGEEEEEIEEQIEEQIEEEEEEIKTAEKESGFNKLSSGLMKVHRSALVMNNRFVGLTNKNPSWSSKLGKIVDNMLEEEEEEEEEAAPLPQSLPSPPPRGGRLISSQTATAATSLNAYEYYWRSKPVAPALINRKPPLINNINNNTITKFIVSKHLKSQDREQLIRLRGNCGEYIVPLLRGCKEARRSVFIWEPHSIAT